MTSGLAERARPLFARSWLLVAMLATIGLVLAVAFSSAARERADALADFSARQTLLATAVSADFEHRLAAGPGPAVTPERATPPSLSDAFLLDLLGGARRLEVPGELIVLVARPENPGFLATDARIIPSIRLRDAVDSGAESVVLQRDEAAVFGLPRRTAVAGVARVGTPGGGRWGLVVLASAQRVRDRQILEDRRLAVTVLFVTAVAAAFGILARRRQRKELEFERRIAIGILERERETALGKADRMAALAALSTGIAHELGTPLGVILGRIEQVLDREPDAQTRASLAVVVEQVERIRSIVRGCLALARGEAPQLLPASPEALVEHASGLVAHRFEKAGVRLRCASEPGLPTVACDRALFEQALVNVLLNACEASPRGGAVELSVTQRERTVAFVVEDDGCGIPDEVARRSTEPFFSTRLKEGGSGLGLTIAKEIVSHHAGALTIEKREDAPGTRATISLPHDGRTDPDRLLAREPGASGAAER